MIRRANVVPLRLGDPLGAFGYPDLASVMLCVTCRFYRVLIHGTISGVRDAPYRRSRVFELEPQQRGDPACGPEQCGVFNERCRRVCSPGRHDQFLDHGFAELRPLFLRYGRADISGRFLRCSD